MTPYHVRHAKLWTRLQEEQTARDRRRPPELVDELARKTDEQYSLLSAGGPFPQEMPAGGEKLSYPPRTAAQFDFAMACQALFYSQRLEDLKAKADAFDATHPKPGTPNNARAQEAVTQLLVNLLNHGDAA